MNEFVSKIADPPKTSRMIDIFWNSKPDKIMKQWDLQRFRNTRNKKTTILKPYWTTIYIYIYKYIYTLTLSMTCSVGSFDHNETFSDNASSWWFLDVQTGETKHKHK